MAEEAGGARTSPKRLVLPHEDVGEWARIEAVLRLPAECPGDLDAVLTAFASPSTQQECAFFATVPGTADAAEFDFDAFWAHGKPLLFELALDMPSLFPAGTVVPLLVDPRFTAGHEVGTAAQDGVQRQHACLSRRQAACLLAHSFFGSITQQSRGEIGKEKWAFRASQLFLLQSLPAAFAFLNYFTLLGRHGMPDGTLEYERLTFDRKGGPPWQWEGNSTPLCAVRFSVTPEEKMEDSVAELHADFANRFVGGGCLENDAQQEEILFAMKPELIVAMALCTYLQDEEVVRVRGALQFSQYSGYGGTFAYEGPYRGHRAAAFPDPSMPACVPPAVVAMDALQFARTAFSKEGLMLRCANKARLGFSGFCSVATGNWGCGAFGNDHVLKFLQQWMAASEAGVQDLHYHTFGDSRAREVPALAHRLQAKTVGDVWAYIRQAAEGCVGPHGNVQFRRQLQALLDAEGAAPHDELQP